MKLLKSPKFYLCFLILLAAISAYAFWHRAKTHPPKEVSPIFPYADYIMASGIVESEDKNIEVGTPEEGIVEILFSKVGEQVKKGDSLFQVDTRDLEAQLELQKASVVVEEANLHKSQELLDRFKGVKDPRAISKEELQVREADVRIGKAKLAASKAEVLRTEKLIRRHLVTAPKDGVILLQNVREGEFLPKNKVVIVIGDIMHLQVRVDIDEQNLNAFSLEADAVAFPKNRTTDAMPLHFTRIEPFIVPKSSLTGSSRERVDTRVLQVIYAIEPPKSYNVYVGMQVDAFIQRKAVKQNEEKSLDAYE